MNFLKFLQYLFISISLLTGQFSDRSTATLTLQEHDDDDYDDDNDDCGIPNVYRLYYKNIKYMSLCILRST